MKPLAIDLFSGLHGWGEALVSEGWRVVSFDLVDMRSVIGLPPSEGIELVIQDVLTLHGSQFKDASLIVASPPCQFFSYCAMPWSRAKELASKTRRDPLLMEKELALFDACFRIQREACEAAGRHIPLIVENVRGAQPWVGRAKWHHGSYFLWGDVPALMPITFGQPMMKPQEYERRHGTGSWFAIDMCSARRGVTSPEQIPQKVNPDGTGHPPGSWFKIADSKNRGARSFNGASHETRGVKRSDERGVKNPNPGSWFGSYQEQKERGTISPGRLYGSKSNSRKAASAMIAKIPEPLARHIAKVFFPKEAT